MPRSEAAFPLEIFDAIITCHVDRATCATLGRVCKSFVPSSRSVSFDYVSLRGSDEAIRFLELLGSPLCTVMPYIRHLVMKENNRKQWVKEVIPYAGFFVRLKVFEMNSWDWSSFRGEERSGFTPLFMNLTELIIRDIVFTSFSQMVDILLSSPSLNCLMISRGFWEDETVSPPIQQSSLSNLRILKLFGNWRKEYFLDWAVSQGLPAVTSLHLTELYMPDSPALGNYLRFLGPSLNTLRLSFSGAEPSYFENVDLSHNTQLQSLSIEAITLRRISGFLLHIISQSASPALRKLYLELHIIDHSNLYSFDWVAMDELFTHPKLKDMNVIEFGLRVRRVGLAKLQDSIRRRLPKCDARGMVAFRG